MSSGVEADIALDVAVVLSLGMIRALGGAAGLTASGATALAALAEGRAEAREAALREAERYERAIRTAIDTNARIAALAASQQRAAQHHGLPADVTLPEPIDLGGRSPEELADWSAATGTVLDEAERKISANIATAVTSQIFTIPADSLRTATTTATTNAATAATTNANARDATVNTAAAARAPDDPDAAPTEPPDRPERVAETLARVLSRVLPDTSAADRAHITEAAERLAAARTATAGEVEGLLTEVRLRVQAANQRTEQARIEAKRLADEEDARRQAEAERQYVLDTIAATFGELGYEVDTGFETLTARDGDLLLTHGGWSQHAVRMRLDESEHGPEGSGQGEGDGTAAGAASDASAPAVLRAAMIRAGAPQSEEERRLDVEREREWCAAFDEARSRLIAAGIRSDIRWRIEPGEQRLPTAPELRRTRHQPKQRERWHDPR
jgi:hypothetical protein